MADQREEVSIDSIFEAAVNGSNVKQVNDVIVLALHASLLSERFHCISIKDEDISCDQGDDVTVATPTSPALPEGWNASPDVYVLQYKSLPPNTFLKCLIKILPLGNQLLVNAVSTDNLDNVITVTIPTVTYIRGEGKGEPITTGCIKNMIQLFSVLNKEVTQKIKRIKPKKNKVTKSNVSPEPPRPSVDTSSSDEDVPVPVNRPEPVPLVNDPLRVGAGDLSPFGRGGGMFMDPLRDNRIGRTLPGFHPPGARYDPVSPFEPQFHPGLGQYGGGRGRGRGRGRGGGLGFSPNPDHLPPPGYDDMFM